MRRPSRKPRTFSPNRPRQPVGPAIFPKRGRHGGYLHGLGQSEFGTTWERCCGMAGLDVRLLGDFTIRQDGDVVRVSSAKALELLGLLIARRSNPLAREAVAAVLWPDERPEVTRRQLRQALWRLNGSLPRTPVLHASRGGRLQVDVAAFASIDLVMLEEAHAAT